MVLHADITNKKTSKNLIRTNIEKKMNSLDLKIWDNDENNLEEMNEATELGFTEVQRKINKFFFSNPDNLDEVFGAEEDDEEDEE